MKSKFTNICLTAACGVLLLIAGVAWLAAYRADQKEQGPRADLSPAQESPPDRLTHTFVIIDDDSDHVGYLPKVGDVCDIACAFEGSNQVEIVLCAVKVREMVDTSSGCGYAVAVSAPHAELLRQARKRGTLHLFCRQQESPDLSPFVPP